mmetsp:Transcript_10771/g.27250  ORF Transcript_10771/g.27250 Transcript_10771/m.27250 type:complete len:645 (+) Transcript_10771:121-2055(+)
MRKSRNSFALLCICFVALVAAFATTSLLESLPLVLASTTPATPKRGLFGRLSPKKQEEEEEETNDQKDKGEVTEETEKKKSSWQFFYKKNEDATTDNKEGDQSNKGEEEIDEASKQKEESSTEDKDEKSEKDDPDGAAADNKTDSESSEKDGGTEEEKGAEKKESDKKDAASAQDPLQMYRNSQLMTNQRFLSPGTIIYRSPSSPHPMQQQSPPGMPGQSSAVAAAAVVNLFAVATRLFFLRWVISKLAFEAESKSPVQHFMWECLNDKYIKDDEIWNRVLSRVPSTMKMSQRKWERTVKKMRPDALENNKRKPLKKTGLNKKEEDSKNQTLVVANSDEDPAQPEATPETSKTVVVMDFSTMDVAEPDFLRFADVVTFLVGSNSPRKQLFGKDPEVIMTLLSPGGEVTSFAFAAAQVARLRNAGWKVTVCVDRIAASGGYMIASQATQILASPFAMVGSVGVITQSLNFYEILKKYGIKSLVLKAGDNKNPITQFGEVTDEDVKTTQLDLDETHQSFIDLCRSRRPSLDPAVCNGRILSGDMALERGMIDRILTSDEYILEKISQGDLVMKLHLVSGNSERNMIANALQILPHLSNRFKKFVRGDNSLVGKLNASMDGNVASKVFQIVGIASMIQRAFARSSPF